MHRNLCGKGHVCTDRGAHFYVKIICFRWLRKNRPGVGGSAFEFAARERVGARLFFPLCALFGKYYARISDLPGCVDCAAGASWCVLSPVPKCEGPGAPDRQPPAVGQTALARHEGCAFPALVGGLDALTGLAAHPAWAPAPVLASAALVQRYRQAPHLLAGFEPAVAGRQAQLSRLRAVGSAARN